MHRFLLTLLSLLATVAVALNSTLVSQVSAEDKNVNRVQPYAKNPFYCQYKGEAVLLLGGSDDDNLFQWTGKKLTDQLDLLKSVGGNYVRNTMSDRDEGGEWGPAPDGFEVAHFSTELARWEDDFALSPEKRAKRPRRACSVERMIGWKVARITIIASTGPTFGPCPAQRGRSCATSKPDGVEMVYVFKKVDGRYDLNQWNDEYWKRLNNFLRETHKRQVFVQIELWDAFDFTDLGKPKSINTPLPPTWSKHPWNPKNNVNYTTEETGVPEVWTFYPHARDHPLLLTVPKLNNAPKYCGSRSDTLERCSRPA